MNTALQYAASQGLPELITWFKQLQLLLHQPPMADSAREDQRLEVVVTPGSQDGLCKLFELVLSPNDYILLEEPTYPGVLAGLRPLNLKFLTVAVDGHGLRPDALRKALSPWKTEFARNPDCIVPKLLYLQANASNPCGVSIPLARRKEIYQIAEDYDLLIVEDAPYHFLEFSETFTDSFLSLDTSGRVVRLDSFSKVLSSGIRVGFATGPKALIDRIMLHLQVSSLQTSTLSQVIVLELLKKWGHDGFLKHARGVAEFYRQQASKMLQAAEKHLKGLAEWNVPSGGMFLWMKVLGVKDTSRMINEKALNKEVLLVPGNVFFVDLTKPSSYLRASFSVATEAQMDEGMRRLAELIRAEQEEQQSG